MRYIHRIRFTKADGTTFSVRGYAELLDGSGFTAEGVRPQPRIEALVDPRGYGSTWAIEEGYRMEVVGHGIKGVVSQVRPVTSARKPGVHHVEVTGG